MGKRERRGGSRSFERFLALLILLGIIGVFLWVFVPSISVWIKQNLQALLTTVALIVLAFTVFRFVFDRPRSSISKFLLFVFLVASLGYLLWIYAITPFLLWFRQHIGVVLSVVAILVAISLAIIFRSEIWRFIRKILNKGQGTPPTKDPTGLKPPRTPIPIETQRQVMTRAGNRCQWKFCHYRGNLNIHHIDKDPSNHNVNNLIYLCPNHHQRADRGEVRSWILRDWTNGKY